MGSIFAVSKPYYSVLPNGLSLDISPEFNSFLRLERSFFGLALTIYKAIIVLPTDISKEISFINISEDELQNRVKINQLTSLIKIDVINYKLDFK